MTIIYANFDQATLDREYSPSSCVDDINDFLNEYERLSNIARQDALRQNNCHLDLKYGPGDNETLDLFTPDNAAPGPLQVFIHGGYWQLLSKDESCFAAPFFQRHASWFAALNYTLAPQQTLTGIVDENRRAIAWLYESAAQFGYDRDRIYLSGSSAGAHLAIMMLTTDWSTYGLPHDAIKGVCALSGIYDLEPIRLTYVNDKVGLNNAEAAANSPARLALNNVCPLIMAYGDNETSEFKRQTDVYRELLETSGFSVEFKEIENRNHFDIVFDLMDCNTWLSRQVLRQMKLLE